VTTRHRILAATGVLIAASVIQLALTASVARNRQTAFDELELANLRTALIGDISRLVSAMQAAQRGYLLTGAQELRSEYEANRVALQTQLDALEARSVRASRREAIADIEAAVLDWHTSVSLPLFSRVDAAGPGGEGLSDAVLREGLPRLKRIESAVVQLSSSLREQSSTQVAHALSSIENGMLVLLALPFVSVALFLFLASYLYRQVLRPIQHFTEASARISAGDYRVRVPAGRQSDEIATFGRAFDAMRRDVSQREEALQSERGRLELVVDAAPVALVLYDDQGRVFLQNALADSLFGARTKDGATPIAAPPPLLLRFDGRPVEPDQWPPLRALAGERIAGDELVFATPEGRKVPVIASAVPVREWSGTLVGVVAVFQDVSHRFELDRIKDDFVSIVSHELRTPLTSMRGALQLALDGSTDEADRRELLTIALTNTERLVRMVNDILDIAKIEAGKLTLSPSRTTARALVLTACDTVRVTADLAGVTLDVRCDDAVPELLVDSDRIVRAVVNLLSNAVKFSPRGAAVEIACAPAGEGVSIAVRDHGPGIRPEKIPLLFERFQQLENIDIRRNQGTGLGLAITRGIVHAHGGEVSVASVPGQGATFTITLPPVPPSEVSAA
jgi:signal transduction histidine kinase/CHASE3 domain sensor protein